MPLSSLEKIMEEQGGKGFFYLIGTRKNSGKTTLLNALLQIAQTRGASASVGVASIGVDGEERDLVFGTDKPRVYLPQGSLVLTSDKAMSASDCLFEPLRFLPVKTPIGRLAVSRVSRGGECLIVGPDSDAQLRRAAALMREFGAETVLVDGAFNRRSQIFEPDGGEGDVKFFLCASPDAAWDEERFIAETAFDLNVLALPKTGRGGFEYKSDDECLAIIEGNGAFEPFDLDDPAAAESGRIDALFLNVPLTGEVYPRILRLSGSPFELIVKSGAHVFLTRRQFDKLSKAGITVTQTITAEPLGVSLRCAGLKGSSLNSAKCLALAKCAFGSAPVFDLFYEAE